MTATATPPSNREWLRRLASGRPHQIIGGPDDPDMRRWYLIPRNPIINVYLHHFLRSDDDRALHDHPWWFVSLILRGRYYEITEWETGLVGSRYRLRRAGTIAWRPAAWRHRVELLPNWPDEGGDPTGRVPEQPCWTLIVTGPRTRTWGFWCRQRATHPHDVAGERFIPWTEFGDAGCGENQ